jgi:CIC family chloride channel protein
MKIIPALANLYTVPFSPKICLCQVSPPTKRVSNLDRLKKTAEAIRDKTNLPVTILPIQAYSVAETIIGITNNHSYDLVVLGASSEGLLQHAIHGNIPETLARKIDTTVIIVRSSL